MSSHKICLIWLTHACYDCLLWVLQGKLPPNVNSAFIVCLNFSATCNTNYAYHACPFYLQYKSTWDMWGSGPCLNITTIFPGMGMPMFRITQSWDHLLFNMGITVLAGWHLDIEMAPWWENELLPRPHTDSITRGC